MAQAPPIAPDVVESSDVGTRENYGFFLLTEAVVRQAKADLGHTCWTSGCKAKSDCRRQKVTARAFLAGLRAGRAPLWSDWLALAAAESNVPKVFRT